ncbi:MAG: hypothetical protein OEM83_00510 [Gammaproteobacteria bacterium]|nr:hypothetical protein [Gammaproteobacteria bacterium]MDH5512454.1 hypothetical protein [Gammaproteobacteria bacterium]
MKKALTTLNTLIIGFAAIVWTGTGESSDPVLADREIPAEVAGACLSTLTALSDACETKNFSRRWVAKTLRGDLFILTNERCLGRDCRAWLVEKTGAAVTALLGFDTRFRLREDKNGYPVIESYTELSATEGAYSRYEWNANAYVRTASRLVYSVDGVECGTREECRVAASNAIDQKQLDRAIRIWENVGGVSWI